MTASKLTVGQKAAKSAIIVKEKLRSSPVFVSLIIFTALLFSASLFLNFLAADPNLSRGLFNYGIGEVARMYPVNISPAGWAFSIWGLIYLLQLAWIIYSLGLLCRSTENGPAYLNPIILSPAFFIFFSISTGFNMGWLFLWDRMLFLASFVFLVCIAMSLFLSLAIASTRLVKSRDELIDQGRKIDVRVLQVAAVNGVAMYATWTTIASLINLAVVLVYKLGQPVSNENASVICLSILAGLVVIYIGLDVTVFEPYTRYSLSPYATVIWALSAILNENYNSENPSMSSVIAAVLLGAVGLAFLIKLGITFYQSKREQYQYRQMKMGRPGLRKE